MEECAYPIGIPLASYPQLTATLPPSAPPGASQDGSPTSGTPSLLLEGECAAYRFLLHIFPPSDYKVAKPLGEKLRKTSTCHKCVINVTKKMLAVLICKQNYEYF